MAVHTLYHFQWSLFSLMARYTIALCGDPAEEVEPLIFDKKVVDLHRDENLSEDYLLNVNPNGQVPSLVVPEFQHAINNTLEMTYYIADRYPSLIPEQYHDIIKALFTRLHAIQPLSLSCPLPSDPASGNVNPGVARLLSRSDISEEWRNALIHKEAFHAKILLRALDEEPIKLAEEQARTYLQQIEIQYVLHGSQMWIFGDKTGATALDAHTIPFIVRLVDVDREDLVPKKLLNYAYEAMEGMQWLSVTEGRPTMFEVWLKQLREVYDAMETNEAWAVWAKKRL